MKIKREVLERIVYEEFIRYLGENLQEAPSVPPEDDEELPPDPDSAPEEPTGMPELGAEELPDDEMSPEEDEEPKRDGSIAQELEGKVVQSITMDEKSKMMPGAAEVVVTFNDSPDALRILLTKTGQFKFFYKGLHNDLETSGDGDEGGEDTLAPDDIDDVPDGDNITTVDTKKGAPDEDEEEEIDI